MGRTRCCRDDERLDERTKGENGTQKVFGCHSTAEWSRKRHESSGTDQFGSRGFTRERSFASTSGRRDAAIEQAVRGDVQQTHGGLDYAFLPHAPADDAGASSRIINI